MTLLAGLGRDGYAVVPAVLDDRELALLREEVGAHLDAATAGRPMTVCRERDGVPYRLENVATRPARNASVLALRAHPAVLEPMRELIGDDVVPYGSEVVFKLPHSSALITLHRDLRHGIFPDSHLWIAAGFYLDAADESNGCLRVLPGSHVFTPEQTAAAIEAGLTDPRLVTVPMRAGDVLLHDARVLHGSERSAGGPLRRVAYTSYQSSALVCRDGLKRDVAPGRPWVAEHLRLTARAIEVRRELGLPAETGWRVPDEWSDEVASVDLSRAAGAVPHLPR